MGFRSTQPTENCLNFSLNQNGKLKTMQTLTDLIQFIFENPLPGQSWGKDRWEAELSTKIRDWRELLKESSRWNYGKVERVILTKNWHGSGKSRSELCETLVEAGGLEFAKRCFYSTVPHLKKAAKEWFDNNKCMWSKFDRDIKNQIISDFVNPAGKKYLPSPKEVESLCFIMADADDIVSLQRLDEMISRRLKAYPVASFQPPVHRPDPDERKLIALLMKITRENGYSSSALPLIFVSSETPPIFVDHPEWEGDEENWDERDKDWRLRNRERRKSEKISIEGLLGCYDPRLQRIIIFERGIKWLGREGFEEKWLFAVVLIHEIGHWITHQLPKPGVPTWRTDLYDSSEPDVHEGWAQLITWWIANQVKGKFKCTFEKLNERQSWPYHVFEQFKWELPNKVMASLETLRLLQHSACLEDWTKALSKPS